jgi:hypothetical protein
LNAQLYRSFRDEIRKHHFLARSTSRSWRHFGIRPTDNRCARLTDRDNNTMSFQYNALGQLAITPPLAPGQGVASPGPGRTIHCCSVAVSR